MPRIYVRFQRVTYFCGHINVSMTTNKPCHLWLVYSTNDPLVIPRVYQPQPSNRPHGFQYKMRVDGKVEQTEFGDTLHHTFFFSYPFGARRLYFYAINELRPTKETSRSPMNAYELDYEDLIGETWQRQNQPDYAWSYSAGHGITEFESGGGTARLPFTRDFSATLFSNFPAVLGPEGYDPCNLVAEVNVMTFPAPVGDTVAELQFTASTVNPDFETDARTTRAVLNMDRCIGVGQGPAAFTKAPGWQRLQIGTAFSTLIGLCGHAYGPHPPDSSLFQVSLSWISGNEFLPSVMSQVVIGPVKIRLITSDLKDISGSWRRFPVNINES